MSAKKYFSTKEVAELLSISLSRLQRALWDGRIDRPASGPGRGFLFTPGDIEKVSWALRHKSADDVISNRPSTILSQD